MQMVASEMTSPRYPFDELNSSRPLVTTGHTNKGEHSEQKRDTTKLKGALKNSSSLRQQHNSLENVNSGSVNDKESNGQQLTSRALSSNKHVTISPIQPDKQKFTLNSKDDSVYVDVENMNAEHKDQHSLKKKKRHWQRKSSLERDAPSSGSKTNLD